MALTLLLFSCSLTLVSFCLSVCWWRSFVRFLRSDRHDHAKFGEAKSKTWSSLASSTSLCSFSLLTSGQDSLSLSIFFPLQWPERVMSCRLPQKANERTKEGRNEGNPRPAGHSKRLDRQTCRMANVRRSILIYMFYRVENIYSIISRKIMISKPYCKVFNYI